MRVHLLKKRNRRALGFLVLLLFQVFTSVKGEARAEENENEGMPPSIERFTLDNGLTVVFFEIPLEKQVAVESFYRAGFMHEPKGKPHLAHVAEHMAVWSASAGFKSGEAYRLLQEKGMGNAETLAEFVHFDMLVDAEDLALALQIDSERISALRFSENILKQEIPKCVSEIQIVQANPNAGIFKFALTGLNQVVRFGEKSVPIREGTFKLTVEDVSLFFKDRYGPGDGILILLGNFDSQTARRLIKKYYGPIPPRKKANVSLLPLRGSFQSKWDLDPDAVFLVYPGAASFEEKLALTLFGDYLVGSLFSNSELKEASKFSYSSSRIYPLLEMPFFAYGEARTGKKVTELEDRLKKAVRSAVTKFEKMQFMATKMAHTFFMKRNYLYIGPLSSTPQKSTVLLQQAINLGITELLRRGLSEKEYFRRLDALTYEKAKEIITRFISQENEKIVLFQGKVSGQE